MKHALPKMALLFQLLMMLFVQTKAQTEIIAGWTFESSEVSERILADLGNAGNMGENAQIISQENINFTSYVQGSGGSGTFAKNANGWQLVADTEKYWQVKVNTLEFESLSISSKQQGSNIGPKDFRIDYSLDCTNWEVIPGSDITVGTNFNSGTVSTMTVPEEASNQEEVFFRWIVTSNISVNGNEIASTGTNRIDDILVKGVALGEEVPAPEPISLSMIHSISVKTSTRLVPRDCQQVGRLSACQEIRNGLVLLSVEQEPLQQPQLHLVCRSMDLQLEVLGSMRIG